MGSMAQDARHEEIMRNARNTAYDLERRVENKKKELIELEEQLEKAKQHLSIMEYNDMRRD